MSFVWEHVRRDPLFHSPAVCCAVCSQHSIQKDPGFMTAPDQCAAVLRGRVLTVIPETMTHWSPSSNMFLTFSPTCFVSLATLASWLVFELARESCSYPGAFEHGVSFFLEYSVRDIFMTDLFRSLRFHFTHILSQQDDSIRNFSPLTSIFSNLIPCFILNISSVPYILLVYLYCPLLLPLECRSFVRLRILFFSLWFLQFLA